jgi:hypothetical protein
VLLVNDLDELSVDQVLGLIRHPIPEGFPSIECFEFSLPSDLVRKVHQKLRKGSEGDPEKQSFEEQFAEYHSWWPNVNRAFLRFRKNFYG